MTSFNLLLLTGGLFNVAPGLSHEDGGVLITESSPSNSQKHPKAIGSWKSHVIIDTIITL